MNPLRAILIMLFLLPCLGACSASQPTPQEPPAVDIAEPPHVLDPAPSDISPENPIEASDIGSETLVPNSYEDAPLFEVNGKRIFSSLDLASVENDLGFSLRMRMENVIALLGNPIRTDKSYSEAVGEEQRLFYPNYELCFLMESEHILTGISIIDGNNNQTVQGISLGMNWVEVTEVLGGPNQIVNQERETDNATIVDAMTCYYDEYVLDFTVDIYYDLIEVVLLNDSIAGPRNTYIGDTLESLVVKFPQEEHEIDERSLRYDSLTLYEAPWELTNGTIFLDKNGVVQFLRFDYAVPKYQGALNDVNCFLSYAVESGIVTKITFGLSWLY